MRLKLVILSTTVLALCACNRPNTATAQKHYSLTGKVVSVDAKEHTALIDAAAIPNYMDAMKMDYPIASESELAALKPGEEITATVDVGDDGAYSLSHIQERSTGTGK